MKIVWAKCTLQLKSFQSNERKRKNKNHCISYTVYNIFSYVCVCVEWQTSEPNWCHRKCMISERAKKATRQKITKTSDSFKRCSRYKVAADTHTRWHNGKNEKELSPRGSINRKSNSNSNASLHFGMWSKCFFWEGAKRSKYNSLNFKSLVKLYLSQC